MITDQDIEKLKGTFATKKDLEGFATKKDLERFATRKDHDALAKKVDHIQEELGDLKVEFGEMRDKLDSLDSKVDSLDVKFDAMLGLLTESMQEHGIGAIQYARHDRQIKALATATGVALPD